MAHLAPAAAAVRLVLLLAVAAALVLANLSRVSGGAPVRAPVSLDPPSPPQASIQSGLTLYVTITDLNHHGQVPYDLDRDTIPDRFEESDGLAGFEFTLRYNPARIDIQQAEPGGQLSGQTSRSFDCIQRRDGPGSFSMACFSGGDSPGRQGTFTLAELRLMPVSSGSDVVELEQIQLAGPLGDDIPIEVSNSASVISIGGNGQSPNQQPGGPGDGGSDGPNDATGPGDPGDRADDNESSQPGEDGSGNGTSPDPDDVSGEGEAGEDGPQSAGPQGFDPELGEDGQEGNTQSSPDGGGSGLGIGLWSAVVAGVIVAAGGLGIVAFRWRRARVIQ